MDFSQESKLPQQHSRFHGAALCNQVLKLLIYLCACTWAWAEEPSIGALIDDGEYDQALALAEDISATEPTNGSILYQQALIHYLKGNLREAEALALTTLRDESMDFEAGHSGALLGIYVRIAFDRKEYSAVVSLLQSMYPILANLEEIGVATNFSDLAAGLHPIQYLAIAHKELGNFNEAEHLRMHIAFASEDFFKSINGNGTLLPHQAWMLASLGDSSLSNNEALNYLLTAIEGGFTEDWRFNYQVHPSLMRLQQDPQFVDFLQDLDSQ